MPRGEEELATSFYEELLGIPRIPKPTHLEVRGGCWFESSSIKIHLGVEENFAPTRKAHPALLVDDLATLASLLDQHGYPTVADQPLEGFDRLYVKDPFGNRIELMQAW